MQENYSLCINFNPYRCFSGKLPSSGRHVQLLNCMCNIYFSCMHMMVYINDGKQMHLMNNIKFINNQLSYFYKQQAKLI